jgi:hypothetical protein
VEEIAEPMKDLDWLRSASLHCAVAKVGPEGVGGEMFAIPQPGTGIDGR